MIDPLVLKAFKRKVLEKTAGGMGGLALLGTAGLLGAGGLGLYGLGKSTLQDMSYGRAERLEEKARRMKMMMAAKSSPRYNQALTGGYSG